MISLDVKSSANFTLSSKVYDYLKGEILSHRIAPGQKINEVAIANTVGVSRTPVREAFQKLSIEGFVDLAPNQRVLVRGFSYNDAKEVFQIRSALEGLAGNMVAAKVTKKQIDAMQNDLDAMYALVEADIEDKSVPFADIDTAFHDRFIAITQNERLISMLKSLKDRTLRLRITMLSFESSIEICAEQHKRILDCFIQHDPNAAEAACRMHIDFIMNNLLPLCADSM